MKIKLDEIRVHKRVIGTLKQYKLFLNSLPQIKDILIDAKNNKWLYFKKWLNIHTLMMDKFGKSSLFFIGQRTYFNSVWPENITNFIEAFKSINTTYQNTHKNGDIGYYKYHQLSQNSYCITCVTPYNDYFNLGIIKGITDLFHTAGSFSWISFEKTSKKYKKKYNDFYKIRIIVEIINEKEYIKRINFDQSEDSWVNNQVKLTDSLLQELMQTFQTVTDELKIRSITDTLTGLHNRLYFEQLIEEKLSYFHRYKNNMTLLIADIDFFKSVNDTYGHPVGDEVLKIIAYIIKSNTRISDIVTRWGGEEFAILLYNTSLKQAERIAELIRNKVAEHKFRLINKHITISIGISTAQKKDTVASWFKRADDALYDAKKSGRNRVRIV